MTIRTLLVLATWTTLLAVSARQAAAQRNLPRSPFRGRGRVWPPASQAALAGDVKTGHVAARHVAGGLAAGRPGGECHPGRHGEGRQGIPHHQGRRGVRREPDALPGERRPSSAPSISTSPPEADARFRIHFDFIRNNAGDHVRADRDVSFFADRDGRWLITRDGDIKQWRKYQVAQAGRELRPAQAGQGPLPRALRPGQGRGAAPVSR